MWHYRFISNSTNIYLSASLTFSWICMNSVNFVCQNWLIFTMKLVFRQMKHVHILFLFFFSPNCKSKSIFIDILISNIEVTCYVNTPSVEFSYVRISSKWHSALPLPFDVVRPTSGHCILLCIVVMCHIHFVIFLNFSYLFSYENIYKCLLFAILYSQNKIIATEIHGASRVFYVTRAFCCL